MSEWLTDEARAALNLIQEPHAERKRYTVQRVAWGQVNGVMLDGKISFAEDAVFNVRNEKGKRDPGLCARSVWYRSTTGWRDLPDVATALIACKEAARVWRSAFVEREQIKAWERVQLRLAEEAPDAIVDGLTGLISDSSARGDHRLAAIDRMSQFAFPDLAGRIPDSGGEGGGDHVLHLEIGQIDAALMGAMDDDSDAGDEDE